MPYVLMTTGLIGMVVGFLSPIYRVMIKKPRRSKGTIILVVASFLVFVLGVVLGIE